jgi:hypothetical protein
MAPDPTEIVSVVVLEAVIAAMYVAALTANKKQVGDAAVPPGIAKFAVVAVTVLPPNATYAAFAPVLHTHADGGA